MSSYVDFSGRPFHFIGIGGIGMSALAYILAKRDLPIYGSDLQTSHITQRLQALGAHIFWGQDASNFEVFQKPANLPTSQSAALETSLEKTTTQASLLQVSPTQSKAQSNRQIPLTLELPQVICSTAIHPDNSEYQAAVALGCPIFHRSDLLAALVQDYYGIAVAGTHGKTTTSSLAAFMLLQGGLDPTVVVGGEVSAWEGNARMGYSPYLVVEADESDGSLVKLAARVGIVTNIELDHPDHYTSLAQVVSTFQEFAQNCQTLIGCIDCITVREQLNPDITYSLNPELNADYTVDLVNYHAGGTTARVWERGQVLGQLSLKLLGQHNLQNSLAAVAIGRLLGLDFSGIAEAIAQFEGARRRFEPRGHHQNILFVDDYAHHPSEIQVTIAAANLKKQQLLNSDQPAFNRVVAIFQPHRYSRTQIFLEEFAQSFDQADLVIVTDIYSAGEPDTGLVSGQNLADSIALRGQAQIFMSDRWNLLKSDSLKFSNLETWRYFWGLGI